MLHSKAARTIVVVFIMPSYRSFSAARMEFDSILLAVGCKASSIAVKAGKINILALAG
jgi:hypothetical protein